MIEGHCSKSVVICRTFKRLLKQYFVTWKTSKYWHEHLGGGTRPQKLKRYRAHSCTFLGRPELSPFRHISGILVQKQHFQRGSGVQNQNSQHLSKTLYPLQQAYLKLIISSKTDYSSYTKTDYFNKTSVEIQEALVRKEQIKQH